jgi:hypothetical protein
LDFVVFFVLIAVVTLGSHAAFTTTLASMELIVLISGKVWVPEIEDSVAEVRLMLTVQLYV